MALKYFAETKATAIRRVNIQDMKRLQKLQVVKCEIIINMKVKTIDPACLGTAPVVEEKVGDGD